MNLTPVAWQSLTVQADFSALSSQTQAVRFFDFQPKAKQAIDQFKRSQFGSLLVLKTETFPEYITEIQHYLMQNHSEEIIAKTEFNRQTLFGYAFYLEKENKIETIEGILQQAQQKILILTIRPILNDLTQWDKLKQALLFGNYAPITSTPIPKSLFDISSEFKLILLGDREEISTLATYDDSLYQFGQYAEIESYLTLNDETLPKWGNYLQTQANRLLTSKFSEKALNQCLNAYVRESESQKLVSISPTKIKKDLFGIANYYGNSTAYNDVNDYFYALENQSAVLNEFAIQDILNNQLYIETEGEEIGQINGLSVIEFDGVPHAFGEPLRISCNVQYGDGEITDIERKVELGGNLHAKGIILAESCLSNLLEFPSQLPFSASLAFEQSYGEVDGDSASLAIFCALVSALAKLPLPQSLAVTGAIDQFGRVLSVGGVNQKIEGFFNVCNARTLTGKQGVIIPKTCLSHLSLKPEVIEAVKAGKFTLWAVESVFDAMALLFNLPFDEEDKTENDNRPSIYSLVHQQIEQGSERETSGSIWAKLYQAFRKH